MNGSFLSAEAGVELPAFPMEGLAVSLMNATGSKLSERKLKEQKGYYVAVLTTPSGETCWANVPVDGCLIKWNNNQAWVLLQPIPTVMSAEQFHAMQSN